MIVVQFDIPMPEHCCGCPLCHDYMWCRGIVDSRRFDEETDEDVIDGKRQKWCPLKEQEAKTGIWIEKTDYMGDTYYDCSVCGESWTTIDGTPWQNGMNYCPHCGAKMET